MVLLINFFSEKKMQESKNNFVAKLDRLLKLYLSKDELDRFNLKISSSNKESNKISETINVFYKNQLEIDVDSCNERIKIDRSITFSEKHLKRDNFYGFLLDLGKLCISSGKLNLASEIFNKIIKNSTKTSIKAESLLELANVFSRKADWIRSLETVSDAETMFKNIYDNLGITKCYNLKGSIYGERGDLAEAKQFFLKGLALINPLSDLELAANLNTNLGIIDSIQGNKDDARKHFKNALLIYNKLDNRIRIAEVNHNLGMTLFESKQYDSALRAFDEGIEIAKKGRFVSVLSQLYLGKSQVLIAQNDFKSAAVFTDKAFEISHKVDDKLTFADLYKVKGIIDRQLKNYKLSESFLLNSLRINKSLKNQMNVAETSLELAALYEEMDNSKSKNSHLKNALNYFKQVRASQKVKEIEILFSIETA